MKLLLEEQMTPNQKAFIGTEFPTEKGSLKVDKGR